MRRHWRALVLLALLMLLATLAAAVMLRPTRACAPVCVITSGPFPSALAIDEQTGRAYVLDGQVGTVSMLDLAGVRVLRTITLNPAGLDAVAVDAMAGRVWVLDLTRGRASELAAETLTVLHTITLDPSIRTMVVDAQSEHAFVTRGSGVTVLGTRSGRILRTVPIGAAASGTADQLAIDPRTRQVFVITAQGVSALDTTSGRLRRRVVRGYAPRAIAADGEAERAFLLNGDNTVSLVDTRSDTVLRTVPVPGFPTSMVVDAPLGRLYAVGFAETDVLDARTGQVLRRAPVGGRVNVGTAAVDAPGGRVWIVAPLTDVVQVLDAGSGALLYTVPAGRKPFAVALDQQAGRVLVLANGIGPTPRPDPWGLAARLAALLAIKES